MCAGCAPPPPGIPAPVAAVFFYVPHTPWRWETNEITNGMLGQYAPKA
jgi:IS30 family transposase